MQYDIAYATPDMDDSDFQIKRAHTNNGNNHIMIKYDGDNEIEEIDIINHKPPMNPSFEQFNIFIGNAHTQNLRSDRVS